MLSYVDQVHEHSMRQSSRADYVTPKTRLDETGDKAFSVLGPKTWGELPVEIRTMNFGNQDHFTQDSRYKIQKLLIHNCHLRSVPVTDLPRPAVKLIGLTEYNRTIT